MDSSSELPLSSRAAGTTRSVLLVTLVALLAGLAVLMGHRHVPLLHEYREGPLPPMYHWDSQSYWHMARGEQAQVVSPFSKRMLYPFLARHTAALFGVPVEAAFLGWNVVAFTLFALAIAQCLVRSGIDPRFGWLFLLTPFPLASLELAYMPDLFHMALVACFFWLLFEDRWKSALVVLLVAFATRESTLLLCVVCAGVAFVRRHRGLLIGSLAVLVLGILITNAAAKLGQPNVHHLPDALYLALKVPYNFALNFLGVQISTNVITGSTPAFTWQIPEWLHIGRDREIGVSFDWRLPTTTLLVLISVFGTTPLFAWKFLRRSAIAAPAPLAIQVSAVYGLLCYGLGPSLGNLVDRLVGYGWPLFWIALPWLARDTLARWSRRDLFLASAACFMASWWPSLMGFAADDAVLPGLAATLVMVIPYGLTLFLLQRIASRRA